MKWTPEPRPETYLCLLDDCEWTYTIDSNALLTVEPKVGIDLARVMDPHAMTVLFEVKPQMQMVQRLDAILLDHLESHGIVAIARELRRVKDELAALKAHLALLTNS